eukprot:TRINITY_DN57224_c0_g1_i1.p1 TRINITY_DN57224_c0_g1~~TRINITY_DN57224_c0_g1_i1.p1  ORF type:complete len:282 (+),score=80.05 TRINITY_DN57224_c0_g1_i1:103-948(+)
MFNCGRSCCSVDACPGADTVRVQLPPMSVSTLLERWDAGENQFVELHTGNRLNVGASTKSEADQLVRRWQESRRKPAELDALKEAELAGVASRAEQAKLARQQEEREAEEREERERGMQEARERHERAELEAKQDRERALAQKHADLEEQMQLREQKEKELQERQRREAQLAEETRRRAEVAAFLERHGFEADVSKPKRVQEACGLPFMSKSIYPIHCAAELGDEKILRMLIQEGADPSQKTSAGKTAAALAQKKSKAGSHDAVLRLLGASGATRAKVGGA